MLGDSNVTNVSIDRISSGNRFVAIELHGKMANISLEIGKKTIQDTAVFKMATGGDMILGEKKFKDPMNFRNYAKLIFAVNKVPITQDRTTAFYRRWIPIELTNYFGDKKNDPYILDKLITQSELSAWFNWSIEGLERLLSKKRFTGSWTAQQVEDWWDNHTNHVYRFIKTRYIKEANNTVKKNKVYQEYEKFCEDNMIIPKPFNKFCGEIISVCPYPIVEIHKVTGRVWKGIRKK